jgi:hypothetical protein
MREEFYRLNKQDRHVKQTDTKIPFFILSCICNGNNTSNFKLRCVYWTLLQRLGISSHKRVVYRDCRPEMRNTGASGVNPTHFFRPLLKFHWFLFSSTVQDFPSANPSWNFRCIQLEETRLGSEIRFSANECETFAFISFLLMCDLSVPDHSGS